MRIASRNEAEERMKGKTAKTMDNYLVGDLVRVTLKNHDAFDEVLKVIDTHRKSGRQRVELVRGNGIINLASSNVTMETPVDGPVYSSSADWHVENSGGKTGWFKGTPVQMCKHIRDTFAWAGTDGAEYSILVSGWGHKPAKWDEKTNPDAAIYLEKAWATTMPVPVWTWDAEIAMPTPDTDRRWPTVMVNWVDQGVISVEYLHAIVQWTLAQIRDGKVVETGCHGAHGRTGTFLAALLVATGTSASDAIDVVRTAHCDEAIETKKQEELVSEYERFLNG